MHSIPCLALPLLLHLLNEKLSSSRQTGGSVLPLSDEPKAESAQIEAQLEKLPELVEALRAKHPEDAEFITISAADVGCLALKATPEGSSAQRGFAVSPPQEEHDHEGQIISGWRDLVEAQTGTYSCLVLALDLKLAWGGLPEGDVCARVLGHESSGMASLLRQFLTATEDDSTRSYAPSTIGSPAQKRMQPPSPPYSVSSAANTCVERHVFNSFSYDAGSSMSHGSDQGSSACFGIIHDTATQQRQPSRGLCDISLPAIAQKDDTAKFQHQSNIDTMLAQECVATRDVFAGQVDGGTESSDLMADSWGQSGGRYEDEWIKSILAGDLPSESGLLVDHLN